MVSSYNPLHTSFPRNGWRGEATASAWNVQGVGRCAVGGRVRWAAICGSAASRDGIAAGRLADSAERRRRCRGVIGRPLGRRLVLGHGMGRVLVKSSQAVHVAAVPDAVRYAENLHRTWLRYG